MPLLRATRTIATRAATRRPCLGVEPDFLSNQLHTVLVRRQLYRVSTAIREESRTGPFDVDNNRSGHAGMHGLTTPSAHTVGPAYGERLDRTNENPRHGGDYRTAGWGSAPDHTLQRPAGIDRGTARQALHEGGWRRELQPWIGREEPRAAFCAVHCAKLACQKTHRTRTVAGNDFPIGNRDVAPNVVPRMPIVAVSVPSLYASGSPRFPIMPDTARRPPLTSL